MATTFLHSPKPRPFTVSLLHDLASPNILPSSSSKTPSDAPAITHIAQTNSPANKDQRPRQKLHVLRAFLASYRHAELDHTPNTIRSLYTSLATRSIHSSLSDGELSALIQIFGTISLSPDSPAGAFRDDSGFTSKYLGHRCYWKFVRQLVSDKLKLGKRLSTCDTYWAMVAFLNSPTTKQLPDPLAKASAYHDQIISNGEDEYASMPYLRALLSSDNSRHATLASRAICSVLQRPLLPHSVLRLALACVCRYRQSFTTSQRNAICQAASQLLSSTNRHHRMSLLPSSVCSTRELEAWASSELCLLLGPRPQQDVWPVLEALALYHHQKLKSRNPVPDVLKLNCGDLGVVCLLETYVLPLPSYSEDTTHSQKYRQNIRAIWKQWALTQQSRPSHVTEAIVHTFLRVATHFSDGELVDACGHFCMDHQLWTTSRTEGVYARSLMAAYISSSAMVASPGYRRLVNSDTTHVYPFLSDAIGDAISRLLNHDALAALRLYRLCMDRVSLPRNTHLVAAVRLSSLGHGPEFLALLEDPTLSISECSQVWNAVVNWYRYQQCRSIHRDILHALQVALVRLLQQCPTLPLHMLPAVQYILPMAASSVAVEILCTTLRSSPKYFQRSFHQRMFAALVHRSEYRLATRLLDEMEQAGLTHGIYRRRLIIQSRRGCTTDLAEANIPGRASPIPSVSGATVAVHPDSAIPPRVALRLLVQRRRLRAAIHLLYLTRKSVSQSEYTTLGNVLLHSASLRRRRASSNRPSPTHAQVARQVFDLFAHLKDRHQFQPDAVTSNILLSAVLKWRHHFDSAKVRVLFKQFLETSAMSHSSFARHTRPMFKQFLQAFHVRGDAKAAQAVVGMLKAETSRHRVDMERWQLLRSAGRRRARRR